MTKFLTALDPRPEAVFHFQTFDDSKARDPEKARRPPNCSRVDVPKALAVLKKRNAEGAGVFVAVNEHPLNAVRAKETTRLIRAVFVDLDGSPVEPVYRHPLKPHIIVESSPGRFHAYWLVELDGSFPLFTFTSIMRRIAHEFKGDPSICESARVLRLPGFMHRKGVPFLTRVVTLPPEGAARYTAEQIYKHFPPLALTDASDVHDNTTHRGLLTAQRLAIFLSALDPSRFQDHDRWFRLMTVCHLLTDGEGEQAFVDWSTGDPKYANDGRLIGKRWRSLGRDGGSMSTAATLVHVLNEEGKADVARRLTDTLDHVADDAFVKAQDEAAAIDVASLRDQE